MADYHPLIARAVAGLEKNTGENRRALYERARTALVAQLRGVVPALDESEITRERLALEEAIRKVEAESARHARESARPAFVKRTEIPRREEKPRPSPPPAAPPVSSPPPPPAPTETAPEPEPSTPAPISRRPTPRTLSTPRSLSEPSSSRAASPAGNGGTSRSAQRNSRTLQDEALRGFRGVANDPNAATAARRPSHDERPDSGLPPAPTLEPHPLEEYGQLEPQVQPENLWAPPYGALPDGSDFTRQQSAEHPYDAHDGRDDHDGPKPPHPLRSYGGLIRMTLLLLLVIAVGGLAYWQRTNIAGMASSVVAFFHSPTPQQPRETSRARPKITDRIGQPTTQPASGPPVAQRVVLYEEDPDDPQGKRFVGTVLWRTEMKPAAPGRPSELAVRADIEVPERKMSVAWSLRRNTDQSLPASHTIEIVFNLPPDTPSGGVQNVPGVLMKQSESTRGVPLAGLAVKVTPGFFLIGLSSLEADMQRNVQLLKERPWFDIPIVYNNNRRAILAMEKGTPGEKAFAEAFAAWKQ